MYVKLGVVLHAYNPSTWEAETGGQQVRDKDGLESKTVVFVCSGFLFSEVG